MTSTFGLRQMRAADAIEAMKGFAVVDAAVQLGDGGLVVVAPHPDDESLGCGGLISAACAAGRPVKVIIVSDGTGSHPRSRVYSRTRLRALRESEARCAVAALGLAPCHVEFLRLADRFVPSEGHAARRATEQIIATARSVNATALFVSWRHDPHCDHQAAYRLARHAQRELGIALYEYSVWSAALKPSQPVTPVSGFRINIDPHRVRKSRAIAAHRSQTTDMISDDPTGFRLTAAVLTRFAGSFETFIAGEE
jgi:LmbE family N-acetylglucosaminyl deacetylase